MSVPVRPSQRRKAPPAKPLAPIALLALAVSAPAGMIGARLTCGDAAPAKESEAVKASSAEKSAPVARFPSVLKPTRDAFDPAVKKASADEKSDSIEAPKGTIGFLSPSLKDLKGLPPAFGTKDAAHSSAEPEPTTNSATLVHNGSNSLNQSGGQPPKGTNTSGGSPLHGGSPNGQPSLGKAQGEGGQDGGTQGGAGQETGGQSGGATQGGGGQGRGAQGGSGQSAGGQGGAGQGTGGQGGGATQGGGSQSGGSQSGGGQGANPTFTSPLTLPPVDNIAPSVPGDALGVQTLTLVRLIAPKTPATMGGLVTAANEKALTAFLKDMQALRRKGYVPFAATTNLLPTTDGIEGVSSEMWLYLPSGGNDTPTSKGASQWQQFLRHFKI